MTDPNNGTAESPAERYAAGKMSESEELAFETAMLEDPRLAAEVDAIQRMRQGFKLLSLRGELVLSRRAWFVGWRYALAAMLALVVIGAGVLMINAPSIGPGGRPALTGSLAELGIKASGVAAATTTILLTRTRGPDVPTAVSLSSDSQVLALKVLPALSGDSSKYRATLERLTGKTPEPLATDVRAVSDQSGFVMLYADASRLAAGDYRLTLTHGTGTETYLLQVSRIS
jgi:hypothetical protein